MGINLNRISHMVTIEDLVNAEGITLNKYADPVEGHRTNLTAEEAERIAREDEGLLYLSIDDYYTFGNFLNDLLDDAG